MIKWQTIFCFAIALLGSTWVTAQNNLVLQKQCVSVGGLNTQASSTFLIQQVWGQSSLTTSYGSNDFVGTQGFLSGALKASGSSTAPSLLLYPNPGNNVIHIEWTGYEDEEVAWSVTNLMGQEIHRDSKQKDQTTHVLPIDQWASGIYILHVIHRGMVYSYKLEKL
ncbi:MAG: T9SS type A sorting domain-containing protein [Flavobacteriales bacterium]|nr:T9SS type A sorting domain-containing protein [Flavobacteriales bacterium]